MSELREDTGKKKKRTQEGWGEELGEGNQKGGQHLECK